MLYINGVMQLALNDLSDVDVSEPVDNQLLRFESTGSKWQKLLAFTAADNGDIRALQLALSLYTGDTINNLLQFYSHNGGGQRRVAYAEGGFLLISFGKLTGALDADSNLINNLKDPEAAQDGDTQAARDAAIAAITNMKLVANLTSDQTWSGVTATLQAGEEITISELVYVKNDGKVWLAKSDAAGTMPAIAMATATVAANAWGEFLLLGFFREDTLLDFTLGDMLYVSDTVAGAFDNVLPNGGDQVQVIGKCIVGVHIIYFNPSLELVESPA